MRERWAQRWADYPDLQYSEQGLDIHRLEFVRWLVRTGRLREDLGVGVRAELTVAAWRTGTRHGSGLASRLPHLPHLPVMWLASGWQALLIGGA